jgi:5-methyltetrahydrofolate--homocysteine methyltransferase
LSNEDLIREKYGYSPGTGISCLSDHTEKYKLFNLLKAAENTGIEQLSHWLCIPRLLFADGILPIRIASILDRKVEKKVVEYASRKNMPLEEIERWLLRFCNMMHNFARFYITENR